MIEVPDANLKTGNSAFNFILFVNLSYSGRLFYSVDPQGAQHTSTETCCYLRGQLFLKSLDPPCPAVPLPALTAVICR